MTPYTAPVAEMLFVLEHVAGLGDVRKLAAFGDVTPDLVETILNEAGRFGSEVLAPLNQIGDQQGCRLENGKVHMPPGFVDAYARFRSAGWTGLTSAPEYGGQGLPRVISSAIAEIRDSANMAFGLCPLLTQVAVEMLAAHASPRIKSTYLRKLVVGEWTGTMVLTEPDAGSDLDRIRTVATLDGQQYRLRGQKIFVTYADHDLAANIVHLVLARTRDAPPGIKGLSLFLVPKVLVRPDGMLGDGNDVRCVSLEHKLGIRASPTAALSFGDREGAVAEMIGEPNRGIETMFTMMNSARLAVGLQGIGIAERAYQQARAYAQERVQGHAIGDRSRTPVRIAHHPDVRRMLLAMRSQTEAARALAYFVAARLDIANHHEDAETRRGNLAIAELLTPVVKAWATEVGIDVANTGLQVHGGLGYIEETGAAQHLRDARIAAIYEGTNGIQAYDLALRRLPENQGSAVRALAGRMEASASAACAHRDGHIAAIGGHLRTAVRALNKASDWMLSEGSHAPEHVAASALPYLRLVGTVAGGWLLLESARAAHAQRERRQAEANFLQRKLVTARFFADQYLAKARNAADVVVGGWVAIQASKADDQGETW